MDGLSVQSLKNLITDEIAISEVALRGPDSPQAEQELWNIDPPRASVVIVDAQLGQNRICFLGRSVNCVTPEFDRGTAIPLR